MKIDCIKNTTVSFTAGKVNIFSDFDETYLPEKHSQLHNLSQEKIDGLKNYFNDFDSFLKNTEDDLSFKITTGRTFGEFQTVAELVKSKGIHMPLPESVITKDGADEFIKSSTDKAFYDSGKFPYDYSSPNLAKENEIKAATGWTENLKIKLKEILSKYNFQIIEHDSENSAVDYGQRSIMAHVRYDDFELKDGIPPQSEWKVGLRNDGNLKIYASLPYDMLHADERKVAYEDIKNQFQEVLKENKVEYSMREYRDEIGGKRPVIEYAPKIKGKALDKIYDTRKAVEKAIIENDMVIAAGDGKNDLVMLNPLNYIETSDLKPEIQEAIKEVSDTNIETILKDTQVAQRVRKLPFIGILIKNETDESVMKLLKHFEPLNKIIEIEKGELQDGIKKAINTYASQNDSFAEKMSDKFKQELGLLKQELTTTIEPEKIEKTTKTQAKQDTSDIIEVTSDASKQTKSKGGKIAAIVAAVVVGLSAIYFFATNKKSNSTKNT